MSVTTYARLRLSMTGIKDYSQFTYRVRVSDSRGGNLIIDKTDKFNKDGTTKEYPITSASAEAAEKVSIVFNVYDPAGAQINDRNTPVRGRKLTAPGAANHNKADGNTNAWPLYAPKATSGTTQTPRDTTVEQAISQKVRLLFHGGARRSEDNNAFHFASLSVEKDYKKLFTNDTIIRESTDSARKIVDKVNAQKKGSIASLDLFSHGGEAGLFFIKGASLATTINKQSVENGKLKAYLYASRTISTFDFTAWGERHDDYRTIYDFRFANFAEGAVIEIHGCNTGNPHFRLGADSITKNLSEALPSAYVIGHTTQASPLINYPEETTNEQQDYRHGSRVIWQDGSVIKEVKTKGHLDTSKL